MALLLLLAACGSSDDVTSGGAGTTVAAAATSTTAPVERTAPRWETVITLAGTGATRTDPFEILAGAIQWRARWKCEAGHLKVTTIPPPRRGTALIDGGCPGNEEGYSIVTGPVRLVVAATGPWELIVDQQVDFPLREPPLEGMDTAPVLGEGDFFNVEMEGKGKVRLYKLADGRHALRFEDFQVSNNTDLFLWLSESPNPRTSADAAGTPHVILGNLRSTVGDQNYVLPPDLPPERVKSLVIWCAPIAVAYIAAVLGPPS